MKLEKVSIITVCLNAEKTIKSTIESILQQNYHCFEYIIIDGNSKDSTNRIIDSYLESFTEKGINFRHYCETDDGIYDAMNKGIAYAQGDWIYFLNSGDTLADSCVLGDVFERPINSQIGCIYGDTINCIQNSSFYRKSDEVKKLTYKNPYIHQAAFVRTVLAKNNTFDIAYRYAADFNQCAKMYTSGVAFQHIDRVIAKYDLSGTSQKHTFMTIVEFEKIRIANGIAKIDIFRRYFNYLCVIVIKSIPFLYKAYINIMGNSIRENCTD